MKSIRLTNALRDIIIVDLMKHHFTPLVDELMKDYKKFPTQVYNDVYDAKTRRRMKGLPAGWLKSTNSIAVSFGGNSSLYTELRFDGAHFIYGRMHIIMTKSSLNSDCPTKLILAKDLNSAAKAYNVQDPLAKLYDEFVRRRDKLSNDIDEAWTKTNAALNSVTTTNSLLEVWPEIEPFVKKYVRPDGVPKLPAVQTKALNDLFGLPIPT